MVFVFPLPPPPKLRNYPVGRSPRGDTTELDTQT